MKKLILIMFLVPTMVSFSVVSADRKVESPLMLKESRDTEIRDLAAYKLKQRFKPVSLKKSIETKKAIEETINIVNSPVRDPKRQYRSTVVNPSSREIMPTILSSSGYVTTLVFVDQYGQPWDIKDYGIGASEYFGVNQPDPNTLWLYPLKKYKKSNVTILLEGELNPLSFELNEDPDTVDYVVEVKVIGQNSRVGSTGFIPSPVEESVFNSSVIIKKEFQEMSDGITPIGAKRLKILRGGNELRDVTAWNYQGDLYLRMKGDVISPSAEVVSPRGIGANLVYKMKMIANPVIEKDGVVMTDIEIK